MKALDRKNDMRKGVKLVVRHISKRSLAIAFTAMLLTFSMGVAGCGSSPSTTSGEATSLISGEIASSESSISSKALAPAELDAEPANCIDTICSLRAMNRLGDGENGEIFRETNRWQIRLRSGTWMIGFYNSGGEHIGYLEINGETAFRLEAGKDIELGRVMHRNNHMMVLEDVEGLGERGFRSAFGRDGDFDGVLDDIDDDAADDNYEPSIFSIIKVKPYDGHELVAPCRPIKIVFNQEVDENTINSSSILITDANSDVIEGAFSYEADLDENDGEAEYIVKFAPTGGYELGDEITVSILSSYDGVLNLLGEPLDQDYLWSFTVRDFGGTSLTCHDPDEEYRQYRERLRNREREGEGAEQKSP